VSVRFKSQTSWQMSAIRGSRSTDRGSRADSYLPAEFFVPELWDTSILLPAREGEMMLDMWHSGHHLAKGVGYGPADPADFIRNGLGVLFTSGGVPRSSTCRLRVVVDFHGNIPAGPSRWWCCAVIGRGPPSLALADYPNPLRGSPFGNNAMCKLLYPCCWNI
jgi:hypothetical protein